jgi:hypothetical protein
MGKRSSSTATSAMGASKKTKRATTTADSDAPTVGKWSHSKFVDKDCHGFVNRSAIGVGVWQFVEGGEHGRAIRDGGSTSLPSFRSRSGGETLRAAIIHYMAISARLQ